jgi:hypothetical protein
MNPNKDTWQDRAKQLLNPLIDIKKARDIRNGLSLVNIANITDEDYQLLAEHQNNPKGSMIEKIDVPHFGRPIVPGIIKMESQDAEIIKIAEKINEIIEFINPKE